MVIQVEFEGQFDVPDGTSPDDFLLWIDDKIEDSLKSGKSIKDLGTVKIYRTRDKGDKNGYAKTRQ